MKSSKFSKEALWRGWSRGRPNTTASLCRWTKPSVAHSRLTWHTSCLLVSSILPWTDQATESVSCHPKELLKFQFNSTQKRHGSRVPGSGGGQAAPGRGRPAPWFAANSSGGAAAHTLPRSKLPPSPGNIHSQSESSKAYSPCWKYAPCSPGPLKSLHSNADSPSHVLRTLNGLAVAVSWLMKCVLTVVVVVASSGGAARALMEGLSDPRKVWIHNKSGCAPALTACQKCELKIMNSGLVVGFFSGLQVY